MVKLSQQYCPSEAFLQPQGSFIFFRATGWLNGYGSEIIIKIIPTSLSKWSVFLLPPMNPGKYRTPFSKLHGYYDMLFLGM